jgi:hypothetical protein
MPLAAQLEFMREGVTDAEIGALRAWLAARGWQTRKQLVEALGWSERKIRDVAELMGSEIVRGQNGFKLTEHISREDLPVAVQACDAAISQGKRMIRYGFQLKKRLHQFLQ